MTTAFLSDLGQSAIQTSAGGYLNPNKIPLGKAVKVRLLSRKPVEGFEIWGTSGSSASGTSRKPFRFDHEPTPEDLDAAFGAEFIRGINPNTNEIEALKFFVALPLFDFATADVRVCLMTQKTLLQQLSQISAMEEFPDITDIQMAIMRQEKSYNVTPLPLTKEMKKMSDEAWEAAQAAGFDLQRLFTGGNPFKAS